LLQELLKLPRWLRLLLRLTLRLLLLLLRLRLLKHLHE
jgi:hypothetical protein